MISDDPTQCLRPFVGLSCYVVTRWVEGLDWLPEDGVVLTRADLVSAADPTALEDTLELLSDPDAMADIARARQEVAER
jgi:hypothetical protein